MKGDPFVIDTGDVDGDGDIDIVVQTVNAASTLPYQIRLLRNNGAGRFGPDVTVAATPAALDQELDLGDLDGDGALDVVVQGFNGSGRLFSYLGRGDATFTQRLTSPAPNDRRIAPLTLADVTADGVPDALIPPGLDPPYTLFVLPGDGAGLFRTAQVVPLPGDWSLAAMVGHFAGDDALDVLVTYVYDPRNHASLLVNLANAPTIAAADVALDESAGYATFVIRRTGDLSGTSKGVLPDG